jgi:hypothetical protein
MAPAAAQLALIAEWPKVGRNANGWVMNTDSGVYGANYLKRSAVNKWLAELQQTTRETPTYSFPSAAGQSVPSVSTGPAAFSALH